MGERTTTPADAVDGHRALVDLYRQEREPMVRLAFLLTGSAAVAQDLVHDAFVRVAARLADVDRPGGYLRTTVVNECRMWWRRQEVERRVAPTPAQLVLPPEVDEVWRLVEALPARQREAVVLRFYLDLPFDEVARVLGCRVGTARSLVHRALASMREAAEQLAVEP